MVKITSSRRQVAENNLRVVCEGYREQLIITAQDDHKVARIVLDREEIEQLLEALSDN